MELKKQQIEAIDSIKNFLNSDKSIFILKGYAGTGKTTLIRPILELAEKYGKTSNLMAPTGRAAKVISEKTGHSATTIHKGIYELSCIEAVEGNEDEESKIEFRFPLKQSCNAKCPGSELSPGKTLIIVDEASMISSRKNVGDLFIFGSGILLDDLLSFTRCKEGGKIIFIGDPAQLPPVGDPDSLALDENFLSNKGFSTESYELTDVVRQDTESIILKNSIKLRDIILHPRKADFALDRKIGEVEDISSRDIATKYCELSPVADFNSPVVICYSNMVAAGYNQQIRNLLFSDNQEGLHVGDKLIVVGNNYSSGNREILNGEFAIVLDFSHKIEPQTGFVYVDDGSNKKVRKKMDLFFRDVTLQFDDGTTIQKKIIESLLFSTRPNITYQEQCALMSNFHIRYKDLNVNSKEFVNILLKDPYYTALRVKFGYAITCHKAQGGEWESTFVDFSGRTGLSRDCLRWSYTAVTRARNRMYGCGLHNIPNIKAKVIDIATMSNVPADFYPSTVVIPNGPYFTDSDKISLKAKYWQIVEAIEGSGYQIIGIEHMQYREMYSFSDADGHIYRCDSMYNGAGVMKPFRPVTPGNEVQGLLSVINNLREYEFPYSYYPSNEYLEELFSKVKSICDSHEIRIVNIIERLSSFKVLYYLRTDEAFAMLETFVNKAGQVTYIAPRSEKGTSDLKLINLVEELRN